MYIIQTCMYSILVQCCINLELANLCFLCVHVYTCDPVPGLLISVCMFVQAIHLNLTTENHLWMFPAWFPPNWWNHTVDLKNDVSCTPDQAIKLLLYIIHTLIDIQKFAESHYTTQATHTTRNLTACV